MTALPYTEDDLTADLDNWILEPIEPELLDTDPPAPKDAQRANYLLRRLLRLSENAEQVKATADAEVNRIREWQTDRTAVIAREQAWLERALEGFMREAVRTGSAKTMHLPNGTLALRAPSARTVIDDELALLEWASTNAPEAVKVVRSVLKTPLVAATASQLKLGQEARPDGVEVDLFTLVTEAGELVPGVHIETPTMPTFTAKVGA